MTERPGHSLQRRLLFSMAAGFAVLLILISILLWTYARSAANRTHDLLLAGAALSILERVSVGPDGLIELVDEHVTPFGGRMVSADGNTMVYAREDQVTFEQTVVLRDRS